MSHNEASSHPPRVYSKVGLSDTLDLVDAKNCKIAWGVITGGAAREIVIFRRAGSGAEYFRVEVPINAVVPIGGFACSTSAAKSGLEVITASAAGDVNVVLGVADLL